MIAKLLDLYYTQKLPFHDPPSNPLTPIHAIFKKFKQSYPFPRRPPGCSYFGIRGNCVRPRAQRDRSQCRSGSGKPCTGTDYSHSCLWHDSPMPTTGPRGNWWEGQTTRKARRARGTAPGHLHPIYQREQVVVGARKVSRQNQREAARRTLGRQAAHFAPTAGTQIPPSGWLRVACTEGRVGLHGTRGEAHHQERACRLFLGRQWRRHVHQELPEMLLIESDSIGRFIASVGPAA